MSGRLRKWIHLPFDDYRRGLETSIRPGHLTDVAIVAVGFVLSWWIYVPVHELLHVAGCVATGGVVTRLEIDPLYGAALLRTVFPFVAVGSDYAGRLTGFDTHGVDATYLATDLAPFAVTVLAGVPLLRAIPLAAWSPRARAFAFGATLPLAYAPFMSAGGDYYEMGSILVSGAVKTFDAGFDVTRWRSDDLVKLAGELFHRAPPKDVGSIIGLSAGSLLGLALAFATYHLGAAWPRWLRRPAVQ
jgi:hypothetical protein